MNKPLKINCPIYKREVLVFLDWVEADFVKYVKKHLYEGFYLEKDYDGLHTLIYLENIVTILWIRKGLPKVRRFSTIAHECLHAAVSILSYAGVPINADNDESMCYYQGFLIEEILKSK